MSRRPRWRSRSADSCDRLPEATTRPGLQASRAAQPKTCSGRRRRADHRRDRGATDSPAPWPLCRRPEERAALKKA